jgi:hypothetical protein
MYGYIESCDSDVEEGMFGMNEMMSIERIMKETQISYGESIE